jgi:hypothetical protein
MLAPSCCRTRPGTLVVVVQTKKKGGRVGVVVRRGVGSWAMTCPSKCSSTRAFRGRRVGCCKHTLLQAHLSACTGAQQVARGGEGGAHIANAKGPSRCSTVSSNSVSPPLPLPRTPSLAARAAAAAAGAAGAARPPRRTAAPRRRGRRGRAGAGEPPLLLVTSASAPSSELPSPHSTGCQSLSEPSTGSWARRR